MATEVRFDLVQGFKLYSRFKCVRKFKFCVNTLVKWYDDEVYEREKLKCEKIV